MMKCPVFDLITLDVAPIIINISRRFIEDLIENFPSAKDLNFFDFETAPEKQSEDLGFESSSIENYSRNEDSPVGFYGHVIVSPIKMKLSYKPASGFVKEFKNRGFEYQGTDLYDLFGSMEKIKQFVTNQLKWSIIKSLPKIAFGA